MFSEVGGTATPIDGTPSYSVRLRARVSGTGAPGIQINAYHFDDTDPTKDPESNVLRLRQYTLPVPQDDAWHEVLLDLPDETFEDVGPQSVNAILLYVTLSPPTSGTTVLRVDDLQFLEWRSATELPDAFYAMDAARAVDAAVPFTTTLERTTP